MKRWLLATCLLLTAYLAMIDANAFVHKKFLKDNKSINHHSDELLDCYNNYENFPRYREVRLILLVAVCGFAQTYDLIIEVHSGKRGKSLHNIGEAIDVSFTNNSEFTKARFYKINLSKLDAFLSEYFFRWGLGIYPNSYRPFFHVDTGKGRNAHRRWSALDASNNYVSFGQGLDAANKNAKESEEKSNNLFFIPEINYL